MADRLQKILARGGIAARRKAEELIVAGRVRVDGRVVTELGTKADSRKQRIEVDGKRVIKEPLVYVLLHKPRDIVCTASDPEGRPTVTSLVKGLTMRLTPIGRLDYATSGVLLLSNDGDFAMGLLHPKRAVKKIYVAKVQGEVSDVALARFKQSIVIDGKPTKPIDVRILRVENRKTWLELTLEEGKNRQIRRLGEAIGYQVMRLVRTHFAGLTIEGLRPGEYRMLTTSELRDLQKEYGVPRNVHAAAVSFAEGPVARSPRTTGSKGSSRRAAQPTHSRGSVGAGRSSRGFRPEVAQRAPGAKGSSGLSGSDQFERKNPAARKKASGPRTGSPAAASVPWSKTTKSGTSAGKAKTRHRPSGPLPLTTPSKRSRRFGSG
jgi:23S rRNA pseudouridine2605 synthase